MNYLIQKTALEEKKWEHIIKIKLVKIQVENGQSKRTSRMLRVNKKKILIATKHPATTVSILSNSDCCKYKISLKNVKNDVDYQTT